MKTSLSLLEPYLFIATFQEVNTFYHWKKVTCFLRLFIHSLKKKSVFPSAQPVTQECPPSFHLSHTLTLILPHIVSSLKRPYFVNISFSLKESLLGQYVQIQKSSQNQNQPNRQTEPQYCICFGLFYNSNVPSNSVISNVERI